MLVDGGSFTSIVLMFGYRLGGSFDYIHMTSFPNVALPMRTIPLMLLTHGGFQLCP
jgi:hypothetical protein